MKNFDLSPKQQAFIIEQFVSGTSIRELANMHSLSFDNVKDICMQWYPKGNELLTLPSIAVNSDRGQFIKAYSNKLSQAEMGEALGLSTDTIRRSSIGLHIKRKKSIYRDPVPFHYLKISIILNLETGIYYFSATEAADTIGKTDNWLNNRIKKMIAKNNTSFIYCGPYNKLKKTSKF